MKSFKRFARSLRSRASAVRGGALRRASRSEDRRPPAPETPLTQDQFDIPGDSRRMREIFQRRLRRLDGEDYRIRNCEVHIHSQAPSGSRVQYTLRLTEPETEREWSQVVTGTMLAGGRGWNIYEHLRRHPDEMQDVPAAFPTFAPLHYIPEIEMFVQVFPYDRLLPVLPLLVTEPSPELVEPLLLAGFGTDDWRVEEWSVEPVKYLAELRATLLIKMQARNAATGETKAERFYAKVYQNEEKAEQTHQAMQTLWDKADAEGPRFTVGEPVLYLSDFRLVIQREATGDSLFDIVLHEEQAAPALRASARTLAAMHLDDMVPPKRRRPEDDVAFLERIGGFLGRACPRLEADVEELVRAIAANLEEVPPVPTHGDLNLEHILLDGDRLALIDLDEFAGADPMRDVARVLAYLFLLPRRRPSFPRDRARAFARVFAEEYFTHAPKAWRETLPLYYAGEILKMSTGFARFKNRDWENKVEAMLEEAKGALAGGLRL